MAKGASAEKAVREIRRTIPPSPQTTSDGEAITRTRRTLLNALSVGGPHHAESPGAHSPYAPAPTYSTSSPTLTFLT